MRGSDERTGSLFSYVDLEARVRRDHLPRVEQVIDIADKICPCCQVRLHVMGEDVSERLDIVPAQFRVIVTRRPKYACRACEEVVVQAPAPARLVEGGIPTEARWLMFWCRSMPTTFPYIVRPRSTPARASISTVRHAPTGWARQLSCFALRFAVRFRPAHLLEPAISCCLLDLDRSRVVSGQLSGDSRKCWPFVDLLDVAKAQSLPCSDGD